MGEGRDAMPELADVFADLEDPRAVNARLHSLHDILVIALCTVVCGGRTGTDMELFGPAKREFPGSFPEPENGIPSHDTFYRVLGKPDPEAFGQWFVGFMAQFAEGVQGVVTVDGKTLRRSYDRAPGRSALHLINAWAEEQRPVLGQPAVDDRSNEVTALPKLLEMLTLRDKAVAADARRCQRRIAQQVIEQGGDYALALKGNQGSWHDDVKLFLDDPAVPVAQTTRVGKGPGRIATRIASVSDAVA